MCQLAVFLPLFYMSFIVIKSGRRSQGTEATHASFESLNHCTGRFEALLKQEMQLMQDSFSKAGGLLCPWQRQTLLERITHRERGNSSDQVSVHVPAFLSLPE